MQYNLSTNGLALTESEINMLDTRIGLNLSRFVPLITACNFIIEKKDTALHGISISVSCQLELTGRTEVELAVRGDSLDNTTHQIIDKVKRHLERNLKSRNQTRIAPERNKLI